MNSNIDDLINKICQNSNYQEIVAEIIRLNKVNEMNELLDEISANQKLKEDEKKDLYNKIFSYTKKLSSYYEKSVEKIYKRGFREASIIMLILIKSSAKIDGGLDEDLEECLNDYIIRRLETENKLETNEKYQKILKEIKKVRQNKKLDKLEELHETKSDIESVDSYRIGFTDAMKFMNEKR